MPRDHRKCDRHYDDRSRNRHDRSPDIYCDTETQTESSSHRFAEKSNRKRDDYKRKDGREHKRIDTGENNNKMKKHREGKQANVPDPYSASGRMIVIASPSRKMLQRLASVTTSDTDKYVVRKAKKSKRKRSLSPRRGKSKRNRSLSPEYLSCDRRNCKKESDYSPDRKTSSKWTSKRGRSRSPEYGSSDRRRDKRERSRTPEKRSKKSKSKSSPVDKCDRTKHRSRSYTPEVSEKSSKLSPNKEMKVFSLNEKVIRSNKKSKTGKCRMPAPNECPLCMRVYEFPILLRCAHTFCKDCVTILVESSEGVAFKCPICESEIPLSGGDEEMFCPDFLVLKSIGYKDEIDDVVCSACKHDREADFYCEDCVDLLCYDCADAHQLVKYTKDHAVKRITPDTNIAKYIKKRYFCTQHENLQLVSHCMTCETSICKQCVKDSHSGPGHDCLKINNAAKLSREEMQRQLYSLKKYTPSLEIALMDVKRAKKLLLEQTDAVRQEISASIKRLTTVLLEREKTLMLEVDKLYKRKIDDFKQQKQNIMIELEQYECASRVLIQLDKHDNSVELLQMKATIDKALKNLHQFKSNIKVTSKTFFLKSNETAIKKAISKHGEVEDKMTKSTADQPPRKTSGETCQKNSLTYIISSDFEENAQNDYLTRDNEMSARKLRTQANWMIVKSRVPDIIQFGVSNGYIEESQTSSLRSDNSLLNFNRLEQAKRMRARANWHLLISRIKAVSYTKNIHDKKMKPKKTQFDSPKSKKLLKNQWKSKAFCKAISTAKSKRQTALRRRSSANWLLVRSRVRDIIDYGKVTGIIPHQFTAWSSAFHKQRTSQTVLKLKRYRAITLRARANWLLVASRLKDIVQYPRKKSQPVFNRFSIHDSLFLNRAKAARNKQIAGEVRAKANWFIVKTRLSDIVLYGKYLAFQGQGKSKSTSADAKQQGTLKTPPVAPPRNKDKNSQSKISHQRLQKATSSPDLRNDERTKQHWHVLIHQGDYSPVVKRVEFDREKSKKNWDKLIDDRETTKCSDEARKNWDILVENTRPSISSTKRLSRSLESVNLSSYSENTSSTKSTVVRNWDKLIFGTKTNKEKSWDKVIDGSAFMKNEVSFQDAKKSRKVYKSYSCDDLSKRHDTEDESIIHWKELIKSSGTNTKKSKPVKSGPIEMKDTDQVLKNWHSLIQQTEVGKEMKRKVESLKHWDELIRRTEVDFSEMSQSEASNTVIKHWDNLVHGTVAKFSTTGNSVDNSVTDTARTGSLDSPDSVLNPKQEKALELWSKLLSETFVENERQLKKDDVVKAYRNWDTLLMLIQTPLNAINQKVEESHKTKKSKADKGNDTKKLKTSKEKSKESKKKDDKKKEIKKEKVKTKELKTKEKSLKKSSKENLTLIQSSKTPPSPHHTYLNEMEALDNWFILIRGTEESKAFKDWEFLIDNVENEPSQADTVDSSRLSARSLTNLLKGGLKRKSITSVLDSLFRKSKKQDKENKAHSTFDSEEEFPENTEMAGTSTNDVIENWHALINDTTVDSKTTSKKDSDINKERATENWVKLIENQTLSTDKVTRESKVKLNDENPGGSQPINDDVIAASEEADLITAMEHWQKLVINTQGDVIPQHDDDAVGKKKKLLKESHVDQNGVNENGETEKGVNEDDSLKHWNNLINGILSTEELKALKHWEILTDGKILRRSSSAEFTSKMEDPKSAWNTLIRGTSVKNGENDESYENWDRLVAGTEVEIAKENSSRNIEFNIKQNLSPRQGTQSPGKDRTEQQALFHWDKLIEGKIIRKSIHTASPKSEKNVKNGEKTKVSVFRNWNKAFIRSPPLPRQLKAIGAKPKKDALENWNKITSELSFSREEIALENWKNLTRGENPYEHYLDKRPPAGANILLEKKQTNPAGQTRLLNMKVKNSNGDVNNVQMKLSSPDKSILSAHLAENKDGTFTIYCCPRTDNDFNMFVSLTGDGFSHELKVVNFYGSFAGIKKHEAELACRTISLIRWHLTPGLLVRKGNKIVAGRLET